MTPAVGLADLIRAVAQLVPRGDDPEAIARILGFARTPDARPIVPAPAAAAPTTVEIPATTRSAVTATSPATSMPTKPLASRSLERDQVALRPLGLRPAALPTWLQASTHTLEPMPPQVAAPPLETLFEPRRHRALIGAALATFDHRGPLDLPRLISQIATRQLTRNLPHMPEATLRRGAWLLLDRSPAMAPFFDDVGDLAARIERVVGRDATRIQQFTARPDRVWDTVQLDDVPIELPPPGTPLVALTDLGRRSSGRGWTRLLMRIAARGSRAVAIVPYPAALAPVSLRSLVAVVPWDRSTKVGAARPARRRER